METSYSLACDKNRSTESDQMDLRAFCEVGKRGSSPTAKQMAGESREPMGIYIGDERQQRAGLFLRDVRYRIHGYFNFIPAGTEKNKPRW